MREYDPCLRIVPQVMHRHTVARLHTRKLPMRSVEGGRVGAGWEGRWGKKGDDKESARGRAGFGHSLLQTFEEVPRRMIEVATR